MQRDLPADDLVAFVDEEGRQQEQKCVEHLARCARCRRWLRRNIQDRKLRMIFFLMVDQNPGVPPPQIQDDVEARSLLVEISRLSKEEVNKILKTIPSV